MPSSTSVPNRGPWIEIPAIVFCCISPIIVSIRFWSRFQLSAKLGADDWVILAALVSLQGHKTCHVLELTRLKIFGLACNSVLLAGKLMLPPMFITATDKFSAVYWGYGKHGANLTAYQKRQALMVGPISQDNANGILINSVLHLLSILLQMHHQSHQSFHPAIVPAPVRPEAIPNRLLDPTRIRGYLWSCDSAGINPAMSSNSTILE
jgi:hypothetical protein